MSWFKIQNKSADVAEVLIYDEIGGYGIGARQFVEALNAVTAKNIKLRINSPGGDAFDAFAMYSAITGHKATVNVQIDGLAASAASIVAMAGDTVCIAKNAFLMIHCAATLAFGTGEELQKQAAVLAKIDATIAQVYADKSGKSLDQIKAAMDAETWFTSSEAKSFGLVDSIGENDGDDEDVASKTAAAKAVMKFRRPPAAVHRVAASVATPTLAKPRGVSDSDIRQVDALRARIEAGARFDSDAQYRAMWGAGLSRAGDPAYAAARARACDAAARFEGDHHVSRN